jgi:hypothetical protein
MRRWATVLLLVTTVLAISVPVSMIVSGISERSDVHTLAASGSNLDQYTALLLRPPSGRIELDGSLKGWDYDSLVPADFRIRPGLIHHWNREGLPYYWLFLFEEEGEIAEGWMAIPSLLPWGKIKIERIKTTRS